jgi:acetyl-CoA C-acetyltransferase
MSQPPKTTSTAKTDGTVESAQTTIPTKAPATRKPAAPRAKPTAATTPVKAAAPAKTTPSPVKPSTAKSSTVKPSPAKSKESVMSNTPTVRRVAILGGNRIPFARSNGAYFNASNSDMLTAALNGLVDRFNLQGKRLGEVVAGAVLKHSRDFNMTRECVLSTSLSAQTPAMDLQQACGTGLQAAFTDFFR